MATQKLTAQLRKQIAANNTIESGRHDPSLPSEFAKHVKQNVAASRTDFFDQLLGFDDAGETPQHAQSHEMTAGQEFTLTTKQAPKEAPKAEHRPAVAAGLNYHAEMAHSSERASHKESQELKFQIQQISEELQRLVDSSNKIVQMEFGTISMSAAPKIVGKYHTNFLSWMLTVIQTARQKVEDSGAWLAVSKGKGGKRDYWNSYKQHGTSFGMSNERSVATQAG